MSKATQLEQHDETQVNGAPDYKEDENHAFSKETSNRWIDFTPPEQIPVSHQWLARYYPSAVLTQTVGSDLISTTDKEAYGNSIHPIAFRIGNGGAGYTGILKILSLKFISSHGNDFRIAWVANHSRHTQVALLADIVQVALTYEPAVEELTVQEGWCRRVCVPAFWDHFILVGPASNPAHVKAGGSSQEALRRIAEMGALFHTRGDGSATFEKEQRLWEGVGIDTSATSWMQTHPIPPYTALQKGEKEGAYLLTDRATFLTAKKDGVIPRLVVFVEGADELLNPCSVLINTKAPASPSQRLAIRFAEWLAEHPAQTILRDYGRAWDHAMPLFTGTGQKQFSHEEALAGRSL